MKTLFSRWASEIKTGKRREAERTLATLVTCTTNPRKNLLEMAKFLCESQIEAGSEVVKKTKSWKNSGVSRHARKRGMVIEITDGVASVEYTDNLPGYDIVDKTGRFYAGLNLNPEP